jgi:hypothetical protein
MPLKFGGDRQVEFDWIDNIVVFMMATINQGATLSKFIIELLPCLYLKLSFSLPYEYLKK